MAVNSEPNEGSRKTLDEIRRELDAEYGFVEVEPSPADVREARVDADRDDRPTDARLRDQGPSEARLLFKRPPQAPRSLAWDDDDEVSDERVEQLFERHQLAMGRRADDDERPRRSGYLLAALIGCVAGQALLFVFLLVTQHRLSADLLRTTLALSPRVESTAPAAPAAAPAAAPGEETVAPVKEESAPPKEEVVQSIVSVPPDAAPPAATAAAPPAPAISSTPAAASESPTDLPPRAAAKAYPPQPQTSSARRPRIRDASDVAEAQARLRSALNEWLRTSAHGGAGVQTTEPVIVLGSDGRTAKTFVSIASPIGMIPREQRWELGARGWYVVEDRQAGLPVAPRGR